MSEKLLFVKPTLFFIDEHHKDVFYHSLPQKILQLSSYLRGTSNIIPTFLDIRFEKELEETLSKNELDEQYFKDKLLKILENEEIQEFKNIVIVLDSSYEFLQTKLIAEIIRNEFPEIKVIVGGHHPSAVPDDYLYKNAPFDYVIDGDLELNVQKILKASIIRKITPQLVQSKQFIELDHLPFPDYTLYLDKYPKNNHFVFELGMSVGCPFDCNFCKIIKIRAGSYSKKRIIRNSSFPAFKERFDKLKEIVLKYNNDDPKIGFTDETFNSAQINKKVLNYIIDQRLNETFKFSCQTRIEYIDQDRESFDLIKQAKFVVGYGFESANKVILKEMNKTKDPSAYIEKMKTILKRYEEFNDPYLRINILAGFPGENRESLNDTIEFLKTYANTENVQISPTLFFCDPVTNVYKNMEYYENKFGTSFLREWWKIPSESLFNAILPKPSKDYTRKELIWDYKEEYAKILNRFKHSQFLVNVNWKRFFNKSYKKYS